MEQKELNIALKELADSLEAKTNEKVKAELEKVASSLKGYVSQDEVKGLQDSVAEMKGSNEELQKHLDDLSIRSKKANEDYNNNLTNYGKYAKSMQDAIEEKFDDIKQTSQGSKTKIEVKATMTIGADITGSAVNTYKPTAIELPGNKVNVADLIPTINSQTGVYVFYRETTPTNAPLSVSEGAAKPEISYKFTEVTVNATYISGYVRVSKVMLQDLPFLQSFLPRALRRDYFKAENANFYTVISTGATGVTTNTGGVAGIIEDIGVLEAADYDVNGICLNPADWAELAAAQVPGSNQSAVVSYVNNQMQVAGVPVFKASWVTAGTYLLGDWSQASKVLVDGLAVEFFEQDKDNVTLNLITARIESRTACALEQPAAFIEGNIVATT